MSSAASQAASNGGSIGPRYDGGSAPVSIWVWVGLAVLALGALFVMFKFKGKK